MTDEAVLTVAKIPVDMITGAIEEGTIFNPEFSRLGSGPGVAGNPKEMKQSLGIHGYQTHRTGGTSVDRLRAAGTKAEVTLLSLGCRFLRLDRVAESHIIRMKLILQIMLGPLHLSLAVLLYLPNLVEHLLELGFLPSNLVKLSHQRGDPLQSDSFCTTPQQKLPTPGYGISEEVLLDVEETLDTLRDRLSNPGVIVPELAVAIIPEPLAEFVHMTQPFAKKTPKGLHSPNEVVRVHR